ncbi:MAG: 50S ribosomal protein L11 methyltransferase [Clostridiales bacterium]|jgi:ribosomal protein L11 methyltransferase|nr:50S ribosomal protein L11 methyltransferase [Clostridiales bacterium]
MIWTECKTETTSQGLEAVCEMLTGAGITGFIIEDNEEMKNFLKDNPQSWDYIDEELANAPPSPPCVKFYIPVNDEGFNILSEVKAGIKRLKDENYGLDFGSLSFTLTETDDAEWLEKWKEFYKPFKIGKKIVIRPVWENYEKADGEIVFTINPGHVFGTGLHQSTRICIEALQELNLKNKTVLDLGCGSGILGIISMMLGAKSAQLTDIDPAAEDTARENAELNGIDMNNFSVVTGNILKDDSVFKKISAANAEGKYGVVIANIVADVIIAAAPVAAKLIERGGYFITSGIIKERLSDVTAALTQNGFEITEVKNIDGWVGVICVFSPNQTA